MKKYIAHVIMTTYLTCEIEAENEDEAYEIYENTDGGDFVEDIEPWCTGSWVLDRLEEVK